MNIKKRVNLYRRIGLLEGTLMATKWRLERYDDSDTQRLVNRIQEVLDEDWEDHEEPNGDTTSGS